MCASINTPVIVQRDDDHFICSFTPASDDGVSVPSCTTVARRNIPEKQHVLHAHEVTTMYLVDPKQGALTCIAHDPRLKSYTVFATSEKMFDGGTSHLKKQGTSFFYMNSLSELEISSLKSIYQNARYQYVGGSIRSMTSLVSKSPYEAKNEFLADMKKHLLSCSFDSLAHFIRSYNASSESRIIALKNRSSILRLVTEDFVTISKYSFISPLVEHIVTRCIAENDTNLANDVIDNWMKTNRQAVAGIYYEQEIANTLNVLKILGIEANLTAHGLHHTKNERTFSFKCIHYGLKTTEYSDLTLHNLIATTVAEASPDQFPLFIVAPNNTPSFDQFYVMKTTDDKYDVFGVQSTVGKTKAIKPKFLDILDGFKTDESKLIPRGIMILTKNIDHKVHMSLAVKGEKESRSRNTKRYKEYESYIVLDQLQDAIPSIESLTQLFLDSPRLNSDSCSKV